ncbi:MAG: hypothetical protein LHW45_00310 [Candidatus Cloacimonetes bacterium]|nr:hypothetical protein [Candidatus Cloacimonadota bacterium]MDY0366062.1 hypothetical protein [Candidatus Syntrophosphaera sp.]
MKRISLYSGIPVLSLLSLFFLLALLGCSSCTKPTTAKLVGRVVLTNDSGDPLLDPVDFAGVTIALYAPAVLDTTIVRLNTKYPQIGVTISQETEFDHRGEEPLKLTTSGADGSFDLEEITPGAYNLAFISPQWGVRYICGLSLEAGQEMDLGSLELFPVTILGTYHSEDVVFKRDHCYFIGETASFTGTVTIQPGSRIYMGPGSSFKAYGGFITVEASDINDAWRILPAREAFTTSALELGPDDYFGGLELRGEDSRLQGGIVRYFANTVGVFNDYCVVNNMLMQHGNTGLSILQGNASISNVITADCANMGFQLFSSQPGPFDVSSCVFMNQGYGISISIIGDFDINNNYFYNSRFGVANLTCSGSITHNEFEHGMIDVHQGSGNEIIAYNKFYYSTRWTIRPLGTMQINYNDFYRTAQYFVVIRQNDAPPYYTYVYDDVDATNNYWLPANVDDYLLDGTDNPNYPPGQECGYYVIHQPRRFTPVPGAGIQ